MDEHALKEAYKRGAQITNSGNSPIASLPEAQRNATINAWLERLLNGERQADIAASFGIHQTSVSYTLLQYAEDQWKEVQIARAWTDLEEATEAFREVEKTPDMAAVARARERAKTAQWQLERLHRRLFGQEAPSPILGSGVVQISINLTAQKPSEGPQDAIEGDPAAEQQ